MNNGFKTDRIVQERNEWAKFISECDLRIRSMNEMEYDNDKNELAVAQIHVARLQIALMRIEAAIKLRGIEVVCEAIREHFPEKID